MSEVIGEGSYGCVHRPSLQCTKKKVGKNKISKLMTRKHLNKELKSSQPLIDFLLYLLFFGLQKLGFPK